MGCDCGKPKCDGHCGVSPAVLQINNPSECVLFHRVEVPASMGDSKTNPPKNGEYKNVLLYYEADQTSWLYSSDGIPTRLTNGLTDYEDAINLPQINGVTLLGDKSLGDLGITDAIDDAVAAEKAEREAADEALGGEIDDINDELLSRAVVFDTTLDMIANASGLTDGSYARTLGYRAIDDNGAAFFAIRSTGTADDKSVIALDSGLYAHMIYIHDFVTPEMFGAYGDGVNDHNDSDAIRYAINTGKPVEFAPKTYMCYSLRIDRQTILHGNGATLKRPQLNIAPYNLTVAQMKWIRTITVEENCAIDNLTFDNNCFTMWQVSDGYTQEQSASVIVQNTTKQIKFNISECHFKNSAGDGLHIVQNVNANISNCTSEDCFRGGFVSSGYGSEINLNGWDSKSITSGVSDGFDVEVDSQSTINPTLYTLNISNVILDYDLDVSIPQNGHGNLDNVIMRAFDQDALHGFLFGSDNATLNVNNSVLRGGKLGTVQTFIHRDGKININNCYIYGNSSEACFKVTQYQETTYNSQLNIRNSIVKCFNFLRAGSIAGKILVDGCDIDCSANCFDNISPAALQASGGIFLQNSEIKFNGRLLYAGKNQYAPNSSSKFYLSNLCVSGAGSNEIYFVGYPDIYYNNLVLEGGYITTKATGATPKFYGQGRVIVVDTASDLTFAGWIPGDDIAIAKDTGMRYRYTSGTTWTAI